MQEIRRRRDIFQEPTENSPKMDGLFTIAEDSTTTVLDLGISVTLDRNGIWRCLGCDQQLTVASAGIFSGDPKGIFGLHAFIHLGHSCKRDAMRIVRLAFPGLNIFIAALPPDATAIERSLDPAAMRRSVSCSRKPQKTGSRPFILDA